MKKYSKAIAIILSLILLSPLAAEAAKKKKRKGEYKGVKYEDVLVVMGITKELFFDFNLGDVRMPTNSSLVKPDVKRKSPQVPEQKKDMIILTGLQEGFTDLWVYDDKKVLKKIYHINVTKNDLKRIYRDVKNRLQDIEGIVIKIRDDKIFIGGELLLPTDIVNIIHVVSTHQPVFVLNYKVSPAVWNLIAEKMQKEINMPEVTVRVVNERFILEGFVNSEEEKNYVVMRAALFLPKFYQVLPANIGGPGVSSVGELKSPTSGNSWLENAIISDFLKIKAQPVDADKDVKVLVHFVEIVKDFGKSFQFQWGPAIADGSDMSLNVNAQYNSGGDTVSTITNTITGTINNFIPKLKNLVDHKKARVLQSAAITVRAGNNPGGDKQSKKGAKGSIAKTTSIPYAVPGAKAGDAPSVSSVDVGVNMSVTVEIEGDKNVSKILSMNIGVSVSAPTTKTAGGMQGKATDTIETTVIINSGETAAIGGIIQSLSDTSFGKSIPDGANPIIDLSRSKEFKKSNTQFVIFATATLINTASEGSEEAKQRFRINNTGELQEKSKEPENKDKPQ